MIILLFYYFILIAQYFIKYYFINILILKIINRGLKYVQLADDVEFIFKYGPLEIKYR